MKDQRSMGDQNRPQTGQNPRYLPAIGPGKQGIGCWRMSTIVLLVIVVSGGFYVANLRKQLDAATSLQIGEQGVTQTPADATPIGMPTSSVQPTETEQPNAEWTRRQFGIAWDIEVPVGWEIHDEGVSEGYLRIEGPFNGNAYEIVMGYPIALGYGPDEALPSDDITIDQWVEHDMALISANLKTGIRIESATIADAPSRIVLNLPEETYDDGKTRRYSDRLVHAAYIWKQGDCYQRVVTIRLVGESLDYALMETFFRDFLARTRQT